jgi:phosphate-selective porin
LNLLARRGAALALIAAALAVAAPAARAQSEPRLAQLRKQLKQEYFSVGALLQVIADAQSERQFAGENGFSIANARLNIRGRLDQGFSYFVQTNFVRQPALLDGRLTYRFSDLFSVDAGQFKAPFSHEFLVVASDIDFVNRSQVVTLLAPGRQIGAQVRGKSQRGWSYGLGLFNGNGIGSNGNDGAGMMLVVRGSRVAAEDRPLAFGFNGAWSDDTAADIGVTIGGEPLLQDFEGTRLLGGVDARWTPGKYLLATEFIYGNIDPAEGEILNVYGYHATAGVFVTERSQLLLRLDQIETDEAEVDSDLLLLGYNFWPTSVTEIQANVVAPLIDFQVDRVGFVINLQIVF